VEQAVREAQERSRRLEEQFRQPRKEMENMKWWRENVRYLVGLIVPAVLLASVVFRGLRGQKG
jgi:hypothetical protein